MSSKDSLTLYVIRNHYDADYRPRLIEARRVSHVYALAPLGGCVRRATDRELYGLAQQNTPIEVLGK